jgi:fructose-1-phosphate kinase PfkB-like protein
VIKREHGALLFHDLQVFFAPALPLEEVLIQQSGDTFAGGFAGFITQSENVSFENMKNAIIYGSNLASLCREIWDRKND